MKINWRKLFDIALFALDAIAQFTPTDMDDKAVRLLRRARKDIQDAKAHALTKGRWKNLKIQKKW